MFLFSVLGYREVIKSTDIAESLVNVLDDMLPGTFLKIIAFIEEKQHTVFSNKTTKEMLVHGEIQPQIQNVTVPLNG